MAGVRLILHLCAVVLAAGLLPVRAQEPPQLAPLPVAPLQPANTDPLQLLPGEVLLMPANPPLPPAPDSSFKPRSSPPEILPVLPPVPGTFGVSGALASGRGIFVKGFRFKGNTVFKETTLQKTVERFKNRDVTIVDIEQARQDLTQLYVNAGYINSGAIIEEQNFKGGMVEFTLVEGRLTDIKVSGNWWTRSWWLKHVARRSAGKPLNMTTLKQGLELLRQDPNIQQVNGELMPGGRPGESILDLKVKERQPFRLSMEFNNHRPPSVGSAILEMNFSMLNLTGHGDPLTFLYGPFHSSSEKPDQWEWDPDGNMAGTYRFPISPWKTTLELHASRNDAAIVEEAFRALNITSRLTQYGATLRQPLYETVSNVFALSVSADRRENSNFLLDRPFSLSRGAIDGETNVFVLSLAAEYVNRSQEHVLALRSTFNIGLDAWGATQRERAFPGTAINPVERLPDGEYFAWLGQAQYVRRLFDTDNLAIVRGNVFLSNNPLLPMEQFTIGGSQSVRGYRENELLRDNGVFGSLEFHLPVWRDKEKSPILTVAPFVDIAVGWDNVEFVGPSPANGINRRQETLASVGLGLIYTPRKNVSVQVYWGYGLNRAFVHSDGDNLQDYGIEFSVSVTAF
jgi:hemolysin activation/secretion protein